MYNSNWLIDYLFNHFHFVKFLIFKYYHVCTSCFMWSHFIPVLCLLLETFSLLTNKIFYEKILSDYWHYILSLGGIVKTLFLHIQIFVLFMHNNIWHKTFRWYVRLCHWPTGDLGTWPWQRKKVKLAKCVGIHGFLLKCLCNVVSETFVLVVVFC